MARELLLQRLDAGALGADLGFALLRRIEDRAHEVLAHDRCEPAQQRHCQIEVLVGGEAEAQPELGVVLEQRVRPGRPAARRVLGPGRHRQVAAVDRRAAGGVGDLQPVAEELREQLEVGRLAAAGAGAGELEQRLEELHAADVGEVDARAIVDRQRLEEGDVGARLLQDRRLAARG